MFKQSNFRKSEAFNMMIGTIAVLALGFGTATAAITVAPNEVINPAMQPLATGASVQVQQQAYGEDDEDCMFVTHKVVQSNGKTKLVRKLECAQ